MGKVVFEYVTKKPENIRHTSLSAGNFHPVNTLLAENGHECRTERSSAPSWHFLWFFRFVVSHPGRLFQGSAEPCNAGVQRAARRLLGLGAYAPREGRVIQNRDIKLVSADAEHAQSEIHNDWLIDNKSGSRRRMKSSPPSAMVFTCLI